MLNLLAVIPLTWLVVSQLPSRYVVTATPTEGMTLASYCGGEVLSIISKEPTKESVDQRLYIPRCKDFHDVYLKVTGCSVDKVALQHKLLINYDVEVLGDKCSYRFCGVDGYALVGALLVELFLFGLSVFVGRLVALPDWSSVIVPAVVAAALFVLFYCFVVGVQSYASHANSFDASFSSVIKSLLSRCAMVLPLVVCATVVLTRFCGMWVCWALVALVACGYLETGILSIGAPSVTGDMAFYHNHVRVLIDLSVLGIVVLAVGFAAIKGRGFMIFSAVVTVLVIASVFDVKKEKKIDYKSNDLNNFVSKGEFCDALRLSTNRNVIVLILDSICADEAHAALYDKEAGEDIRSKLNGFVEYTDVVASHGNTMTAIPSMLLGTYVDANTCELDYANSVWSKSSVLCEYEQNGFNVYAIPGCTGLMYVPRELGIGDQGNPVSSKDPLSLRINDAFKWSIDEISVFRCLPSVAKSAYFHVLHLDWLLAYNIHGSVTEKGIFKTISEAPVLNGRGNSFVFLHMEGTHVPIMYSRTGAFREGCHDDFEGAVEQSVYLFRLLGDMMEAMRKRDLYDNSLIVVLSDHGPHYGDIDYSDAELPRRARPFLLIKYPNGVSDFSKSDLPVSLINIAPFLRSAIGDALTKEDDAILSGSSRLFRLKEWEEDFVSDWNIDENGKVTYKRHQ